MKRIEKIKVFKMGKSTLLLEYLQNSYNGISFGIPITFYCTEHCPIIITFWFIYWCLEIQFYREKVK